MEHLYKLKDMLWKELEEYGEKGELTAGSLDVIEKLVVSIYKLCRILEDEGGGSYGNGSYEGSYEGSYDRGSYDMGGYSGARRRGANQYGSYARGYSRTGEIAERLQKIAHEAPNEKMRQEIEQLASKMRSM